MDVLSDCNRTFKPWQKRIQVNVEYRQRRRSIIMMQKYWVHTAQKTQCSDTDATMAF